MALQVRVLVILSAFPILATLGLALIGLGVPGGGMMAALPSAVWVLSAGLLLGGLLADLLVRRLLRPVASIIRAVAAIETHTFDPALLAALTPRADDWGHLARLLARTAQAQQEREAQLHQQMVQLRIEIDTMKRMHDVAEITESATFEAVQAQVAALRAKYAPTPKGLVVGRSSAGDR